MTWLWAALVLAVLGVTVAVAAGRGAGLAESAPDRPAARLPAGRPLTDADLRAVRFGQSLRGYAMDEVDDFVDRVRAELAIRPAEPPDPQDVLDPRAGSDPQDRTDLQA